jgi:hypothetical protein
VHPCDAIKPAAVVSFLVWPAAALCLPTGACRTAAVTCESHHANAVMKEGDSEWTPGLRGVYCWSPSGQVEPTKSLQRNRDYYMHGVCANLVKGHKRRTDGAQDRTHYSIFSLKASRQKHRFRLHLLEPETPSRASLCCATHLPMLRSSRTPGSSIRRVSVVVRAGDSKIYRSLQRSDRRSPRPHEADTGSNLYIDEMEVRPNACPQAEGFVCSLTDSALMSCHHSLVNSA